MKNPRDIKTEVVHARISIDQWKKLTHFAISKKVSLSTAINYIIEAALNDHHHQEEAHDV